MIKSPVDRFIGTRIRERRVTLGLSPYQFADLIGVTYQQVFKYEHGINRVSASRLYEIARELETPLDYFFEGLEKNEAPLSHRQRMLIDLLRNFGEIKNEKHREVISQITRLLADR
jgi:transcriptional regulator with XRE-family HTH domain